MLGHDCTRVVEGVPRVGGVVGLAGCGVPVYMVQGHTTPGQVQTHPSKALGSWPRLIRHLRFESRTSEIRVPDI